MTRSAQHRVSPAELRQYRVWRAVGAARRSGRLRLLAAAIRSARYRLPGRPVAAHRRNLSCDHVIRGVVAEVGRVVGEITTDQSKRRRVVVANPTVRPEVDGAGLEATTWPLDHRRCERVHQRIADTVSPAGIVERGHADEGQASVDLEMAIDGAPVMGVAGADVRTDVRADVRTNIRDDIRTEIRRDIRADITAVGRQARAATAAASHRGDSRDQPRQRHDPDRNVRSLAAATRRYADALQP